MTGDTFLTYLRFQALPPLHRAEASGSCARQRRGAGSEGPELLVRMTGNGKLPELALLMRVREAFFHRGKSLIRSGMWEPDRWGSINGLPTYPQALKDHASLQGPLSDIEREVALNETDRLY